TSIHNYAVPGAGTLNPSLTSLTLTDGGQFDSCLAGTATSSAKIVTGYSLTTGTSSFTISMWLSNLVTPPSTRYLFGDGGHSFRCFVGGVAPSGGAVLRGTGVTDVQINGIFPGPNVIHIVYDSAASNVKVYKNGSLINTVAQTPFNFTAGTGFSVGGYSSSAGIDGKMDEFRFYKRALDSSEIAATWNVNLGNITAITPVSTQIPETYSLSQNYPNPFNPVTKINFEIAKQGLVTLKVFDMLGRQVSELINGFKPAGQYSVDFNAANLSSGVYLYKLEVNGYSNVKKMILIK
ncbi:MAG TPA: T9SS type A sorting domain-containing protein, partial [Ignavibacteria bacterium]|nr:T9SS type A sorting domain-containing protein [Ignavibacteria bacterium]